MNRLKVKTKSGQDVFKFQMSEDEYRSLDYEHAGLCVGCGEETNGGVEPDARRYDCESCGVRKVYGIQELVLMGFIEITDGG